MTAAGCGCLIQELLPGGDDQLFGALCCLRQGCEPLAALAKSKLSQYPEQFGNGGVQISVDLPDLAASSNELLRKLGCRGGTGVQRSGVLVAGEAWELRRVMRNGSLIRRALAGGLGA